MKIIIQRLPVIVDKYVIFVTLTIGNRDQFAWAVSSAKSSFVVGFLCIVPSVTVRGLCEENDFLCRI